MVIDTNVVSYIFNQDDRAIFYISKMRGIRGIISFQTLEEVWYGAYSRGWGTTRRRELELHMRRYDVVWPDSDLVDVCARLRHERRSVGRVMSHADAWIAATALLLDCPLASSDQDFRGIPELELIQAA